MWDWYVALEWDLHSRARSKHFLGANIQKEGLNPVPIDSSIDVLTNYSTYAEIWCQLFILLTKKSANTAKNQTRPNYYNPNHQSYAWLKFPMFVENSRSRIRAYFVQVVTHKFR